MAKAYWIAQVDIEDPEAYKDYVAANALPFAKFGAKFLARGGGTDVVEDTTARASSSSSSPISPPREPATSRRNTRLRWNCARRRRAPISSSSKAMMGRSRATANRARRRGRETG